MKHSQRAAIDGYRHAAKQLAELFAEHGHRTQAVGVLGMASIVTDLHDSIRVLEGDIPKPRRPRLPLTLEPKA